MRNRREDADFEAPARAIPAVDNAKIRTQAAHGCSSAHLETTKAEPITILASDFEEITEEGSSLSFTFDDGVEYYKPFSINNNKFSLKLYGPVIKKKPGLRLRFTRPGESEQRYFEMKAYGNGKKQGIHFEFTF